jgi:hypothetical protein
MEILRPSVPALVMSILELIGKTEQDDLTAVMDQLIDRYMEEIVPIAVQVASGLVCASVCV